MRPRRIIQNVCAKELKRREAEETELRLLRSSHSLMASLGPLSSLRLDQSSSSFSNPNPKFILPSRFRTTSLSFSSHSDQQNSSTVSEKKSNRFSVATGDFFLRIASRLIKTTWDVSDGTNGVATSVNVDDAIDREIIWEQRIKNVDTEIEMDKDAYAKPKAKLPAGFSFSAAGLLFPYHLGVAQYLIEKGYITETTPLAGSSAGAIVCAVVASGSSMQEALEATKILAEDCRLRGTAFRLGAVLRDILVKFLPDDVHTRSNGRVRVAVTQVFRRPMGLLVDQFDSKEDLIDAVFTSSFIPGYLAPRPATFFRNRLCIDGGLTLFMPPTSASKTVRICAFPTDRMGLQGVGISPDCNPDNRATPQQLFKWALEPAEDHVLDKLFELGYLDAAVWGKRNPLEEVLGVNSNNASPRI